MTYLLDTSALSEPARPQPDPGLLERLSREQEGVATASVVIHELVYGVSRLPDGHRRRDLEAYLASLLHSALPVLPYDGAAAQWHGRIRAELESAGRPTPFVDGQIAAIASVNRLCVVTRNTADFEPFPELAVENWFSG